MEHDDGHEKATGHDTERKLNDFEEDGPPPPISAVLAKHAAGKLKGRR
jgi:hypothetical protein